VDIPDRVKPLTGWITRSQMCEPCHRAVRFDTCLPQRTTGSISTTCRNIGRRAAYVESSVVFGRGHGHHMAARSHPRHDHGNSSVLDGQASAPRMIYLPRRRQYQLTRSRSLDREALAVSASTRRRRPSDRADDQNGRTAPFACPSPSRRRRRALAARCSIVCRTRTCVVLHAVAAFSRSSTPGIMADS